MVLQPDRQEFLWPRDKQNHQQFLLINCSLMVMILLEFSLRNNTFNLYSFMFLGNFPVGEEMEYPIVADDRTAKDRFTSEEKKALDRSQIAEKGLEAGKLTFNLITFIDYMESFNFLHFQVLPFLLAAV